MLTIAGGIILEVVIILVVLLVVAAVTRGIDNILDPYGQGRTRDQGRPVTCREWLRILQDVGEDIAAFESSFGRLTNAVPARFAQLPYGRLYDMALGPR